MTKYKNIVNQASQQMIEADMIELVDCVFGQLNQGNQAYTYKAPKGMCQTGDTAVVMTKSGLKFVTVKEVQFQPVMPNTSYHHEWISCVVHDVSVQFKLKEAEIVTSLDS